MRRSFSRDVPFDAAVAANVAAYTKRAPAYDCLHPEIFNAVEQGRLAGALAEAVGAIQSGGIQALDFGCGTGNVSTHLCQMGLQVTGADVTPEFLDITARRLGIKTILLEGGDPSALGDATYDLVAVYSVLHHIPDYLSAVATLIRKVRPGGVLFLDHERNDNYWAPPASLEAYRREFASEKKSFWWSPEHRRWQFVLRAAASPSRHAARYRKWRRIGEEGDIHVYPDDHIQWDDICEVLLQEGAQVIARCNYLHYPGHGDLATWERWRRECNDMAYVIARGR